MTESKRHLAVVGAARRAEASAWVDDDSLVQVGQLAKATGKTVRAIHLYESLGLITPVRRSKGRYRLFSPDAKLRIGWISKLQSLGLSLPDIQALSEQRAASDSARLAATELRDVYREKLDEVRQLLARYRGLEAELEASLTFLETCGSDCNHHAVDQADCSACHVHGTGGEQAPELVAGATIR